MGGKVSNSKSWSFLLISEDLLEKSNICVIKEGIFKFLLEKNYRIFNNKIIKN